MKRILVDAYYYLNLGDDLFLKILFDRYPNVQWDLLTPYKKYELVFKEYRNVKIIKSLSQKIINRKYNLFKKINDNFFDYKKYDAYVNIGGSIFMEREGWENNIQSRKNIPLRFKKNGKNTFIIGSNFGPFESKSYIEQHKELFKYFDDICFRDFYSYNLFHNLNQVRVAPDVVFCLDTDGFYSKEEKSVGFSLIDLQNRSGLSEYQQHYENKIIEFIEEYLKRDYKIKLFSFCKNEGDLYAINRVLNMMNTVRRHNIKVIKYEGDINYFLKEYKSCKTIIGTRFHSIILALIFKQNVFPIVYSDKTFHVLEDLNMTDHYSYIKNVNDLRVKEVIRNIHDNTLNNENTLISAEGQFKGLDNLLKES
ncbi:polysaccharide pyruvyl transferase family protein [Halobacillus sp. K22]|uniref:polysaccharide pyruvyl transferase family protein n=1 Tax=Halobacillus sp. K22 TaxID=3457431 RepID=UPI003FCD2526